jgi:hypothetical protein
VSGGHSYRRAQILFFPPDGQQFRRLLHRYCRGKDLGHEDSLRCEPGTGRELSFWLMGAGCAAEEVEEAVRLLGGRDEAKNSPEAPAVIARGEELRDERRAAQSYARFLETEPRWQELLRVVGAEVRGSLLDLSREGRVQWAGPSSVLRPGLAAEEHGPVALPLPRVPPHVAWDLATLVDHVRFLRDSRVLPG